ncbi:HutD/Ves family protein [Providencia heimbachae]|uniref:HutD family protein n=1 Tax=Providencia heimbachae ATCC 35613 TaxID=1354272 RepID=A0A1B7K2U0_9GAMM|nr:HutD family protein [Providencia heimbachae]MDD9340594.1 HutD family protein [Providencia heimbachae]OAT54460.1 hypothetical protein M998_0451 [Providencia heimbachae ATCC 35613]SQH13510.1 Various environmental stresses-induced protein [Providencia heimbachae]
MKIKCFNTTELPVFEWSDGSGASQEIFCWPVASDYSLRASIATIKQDSFLKQYSGGERLAILLDNNELNIITDDKCGVYRLKQAGDSIQIAARQYANINVIQAPANLLSFIFRADRWIVKSNILTEAQKLPINQAGMVYVLSGEWSVSGGNCNLMRTGDGGWWLPDIGEGELKPLTRDSQLIWIEIIPS